MRATIVLLADSATSNYGAKLMLSAHQIGQVGFEMARLPFHVSLKQTFAISDLNEMEKFFDEFAKNVPQTTVVFENLQVMPNNSIGGIESGCLSLRVKKTEYLDSLQKKLFAELEERFGPCPAPFDNDYIFHMTIAIGNAPYANYQKAYDQLSLIPCAESGRFDKLGLFYYNDDNINPGTYFCYKTIDLK